MKRAVSFLLVCVLMVCLSVSAFAFDVVYDYSGGDKDTVSASGKTKLIAPDPAKTKGKGSFAYWDNEGKGYQPGEEYDVQSNTEFDAVYWQIMFRPWKKGSEEGIWFGFNPSDDLIVKVDKVETKEFTYENQKLTLNPEFLETLDEGIRILEVYSKGGNYWDAFVIEPAD